MAEENHQCVMDNVDPNDPLSEPQMTHIWIGLMCVLHVAHVLTLQSRLCCIGKWIRCQRVSVYSL